MENISNKNKIHHNLTLTQVMNINIVDISGWFGSCSLSFHKNTDFVTGGHRTHAVQPYSYEEPVIAEYRPLSAFVSVCT